MNVLNLCDFSKILRTLIKVIIIIIISIFKEDNVFSMIASLPYGPPVNTDISNYNYQTFFRTFFCKCCNVSCSIFVRRIIITCCKEKYCNLSLKNKLIDSDDPIQSKQSISRQAIQ